MQFPEQYPPEDDFGNALPKFTSSDESVVARPVIAERFHHVAYQGGHIDRRLAGRL